MKIRHPMLAALPVALLLSFFQSPTAFAGVVTEIHGNTGSASVLLGDLDLSTPAGASTAQRRVLKTAERLCSKLSDHTSLARQPAFVACVDDAVSGAMQTLAVAGMAAHPAVPLRAAIR